LKNKRWISRASSDPEKVQELIAKLNAPKVVAEILVSRGMDTPEKVKSFYNPKLSQLHDPFLMKDMDKAIARINRAKENGEHIMIYGDYDVDGTTSVALTYGFFRKEFKQIQYYIPDRYKEGYGISKLGIDTAAESGVSLIIALDCGIRSVELVAYAKTKGIDFIICDHHLPGDEIPEAVAVLDPKRKDCTYPFKELCGCGIGFKLIQAYAETNQLDKNIILKQLDLVTLAIASDIVPIVGENRILAYYGLRLINSSPRPGIAKLIEIAINKPKLSIGDLVFYVGPRINAAGRMHSALDAVSLLLQENADEAEKQAKVLHTHNTERQAVDEKITAEIQEIIHQNPNLLERKTLVFYKEDWHKGVVGIAASRAIELYYRPTIILTKSGDVLAGSARSVKGFDVHEALMKCNDHLTSVWGTYVCCRDELAPRKPGGF
jgi:single-stranded-DNA-specific exonuclease